MFGVPRIPAGDLPLFDISADFGTNAQRAFQAFARAESYRDAHTGSLRLLDPEVSADVAALMGHAALAGYFLAHHEASVMRADALTGSKAKQGGTRGGVESGVSRREKARRWHAAAKGLVPSAISNLQLEHKVVSSFTIGQELLNLWIPTGVPEPSLSSLSNYVKKLQAKGEVLF